MKKTIVLILAAIMIVGLLAGCDAASTATENIKKEADNFGVYRKVTAINNQTDNVLFSCEGFLSYTNEEDGDLSIVINTGKDKYMRHTVHMNDRTTFVVEQLDASEFGKYEYKFIIYANYPSFNAGSEAE